MEVQFLESLQKQFAYYKQLGDNTMSQLDDHHLFETPSDESNSIAVIVGHLSGNMLSRWTDFLTTDGEKDWRNRDREFEPVLESRTEVLAAWEAGWTCLFDALGAVNSGNFQQLVYIRNQGHSIVEAFHRQLAHYAYHVGQVVYVGRLLKGAEWKSLSIAKGASNEFNQKTFGKGKRRAHFTDEE